MLVRVVAVALIGWTLAEIAVYLTIAQHNNESGKVFPCVIRSLPLIAGVAMLIKAKRLAEWIADTLDL